MKSLSIAALSAAALTVSALPASAAFLAPIDISISDGNNTLQLFGDLQLVDGALDDLFIAEQELISASLSAALNGSIAFSSPSYTSANFALDYGIPFSPVGPTFFTLDQDSNIVGIDFTLNGFGAGETFLVVGSSSSNIPFSGRIISPNINNVGFNNVPLALPGSGEGFSGTIGTEPVPEPLTILGTGAALAMGYVARRRQKREA